MPSRAGSYNSMPWSPASGLLQLAVRHGGIDEFGDPLGQPCPLDAVGDGPAERGGQQAPRGSVAEAPAAHVEHRALVELADGRAVAGLDLVGVYFQFRLGVHLRQGREQQVGVGLPHAGAVRARLDQRPAVENAAAAAAQHGAEEAIAALLRPEAPLPGGGRLTIEPTRALVAVDVDTATATVTVTMTQVNDAPVAMAESYSVNEDATLMADGVGGNPAGVLGNDNDPNDTPADTLSAAPTTASVQSFLVRMVCSFMMLR